MEQGIYYLLTIVALGLVMHWYIRNDGVGPGERTTGLLSMDPPAANETARGGRFGQRRR